MIALTATITKAMQEDVIDRLDMKGCELVSASPNRSNIFYSVSTIEDFVDIIEDVRVT